MWMCLEWNNSVLITGYCMLLFINSGEECNSYVAGILKVFNANLLHNNNNNTLLIIIIIITNHNLAMYKI